MTEDIKKYIIEYNIPYTQLLYKDSSQLNIMTCFAGFLPSLNDYGNKIKINFIWNLFFLRNFSRIYLDKFNLVCAFIGLSLLIRGFKAFIVLALGVGAFILANISPDIPYYQFKCPARGSALKEGINTHPKVKKTACEACNGPQMVKNFNRSGETHLLILSLC